MKLKIFGIFLIFIIIGFNNVSADSGDTLGSAYNLGRMIEGFTFSNETNLLHHNEMTYIVNDFKSRFGINNTLSIGGKITGASYTDRTYGYAYGSIPELDFEFKPHPSHRVNISLFPRNLVVVMYPGEIHTGLEGSFSMANFYEWNYLSNDGLIVVDPGMYENAFYFRPLLNQGQIAIGDRTYHTLGDITDNIFYTNLYAAFGITNNVQVSTGGVVVNKWDGIHNDYEYPDINMFTSFGATEFGYNAFRINSGYVYENVQSNIFKETNKNVFITLSHLLGSHITSIGQVQGNWNNYFTPRLGLYQLLAQFGIDYTMSNIENPSYMVGSHQPSILESQLFSMDMGLHFGLTDFFSIGGQFVINKGYGMKPKYEMTMDAITMNIPIRQKGPEHVSAHEYTFGHWPKKGEYRIEPIIHLSFPKPKKVYEHPTHILEYVYDKFSYLEYDNDLLMERGKHWDDFAPFKGIFGRSDFILKEYTGLSDNVVLSNTFELKKINYTFERSNEEDDYGSYIYDYDDYKRVVTNLLFANQFGVSIGDPKRCFYTFMVSIIGQTDPNTEGSSKVNFLLSGILQGAF